MLQIYFIAALNALQTIFDKSVEQMYTARVHIEVLLCEWVRVHSTYMYVCVYFGHVPW